MAGLTESVVEDAALAWLESLGYAIKHGPETGPDARAGGIRIFDDFCSYLYQC
jgi:hypothetical protein